MPYGITWCNLPYGRDENLAFTPAEAATRFGATHHIQPAKAALKTLI